MQRVKHFAILILAILGVFSCKPGIPRVYLQPDEMADILYDYHLADGIQSVQPSNDSVSMRAFQTYILKKYNVSQADFDSSLVYYTRHTKLLEDVYDEVAERLNRESAIYGGSQLSFDGEDVSNSDTTNIWQSSPSMILSPYIAFNRKAFEIKADTSYYAGDKIMLDFDTQFIYQDGVRDAVAVLAVTYDNDSIEIVNNSVMSSSHYHLQISNSGRLKIKAVRGFWLHNNTTNQALSSKTTLKMLLVSNIKLIRMHTKPVEQPIDTVAASNNADSLRSKSGDSLVLKKPLKLVDKQIPIKNK